MYNTPMLDLIDAKVGDAAKVGPVGRPNPKSGWPLDMAEKLPKMMVEAGIPALEITGGGEPTLWRGFDDLMVNSLNAGLDVAVVTNASVITEARARLLARCIWIRFSLDAPNATVHQRVHRISISDFDRRLQGIAQVVREKRRIQSETTIGISYVIMPENIDDLEEMCRLCQGLGVDNLRFSFMYDKSGKAGLTDEQYESLIPRLKELQAKYSIPGFAILFDGTRLWTYSQPNTDFKTCNIQRFVWAIGADCKVYPCCIMKYHPDFAFADITQQSLKEIITDAAFVAKQNNLKPTACFPCWLRTRNQSIEAATVKPKHHNFL